MAMAEACLGGIGNTHLILRGCKCPPLPSASPPNVVWALATSQDAVGIFQYLLARPLPMSHCNREKNKL